MGNTPTDRSHANLLERFYRGMLAVEGFLLFIGVPFIFVQKWVSAVALLLVLALTLYCWKLARRGQLQKSIKILAWFVWWLIVPMMFFGLSSAFTGLLLSFAVMLAVIDSKRSGVLFGIGYLFAWLVYVALVHFNLQPTEYFSRTPVVTWFVSAVAFLMALLPITGLIEDTKRAIAAMDEETQRRAHVEAELRVAIAHAHEATQAKGQFLANMSHEIRTPMNAITGLLRLLQHTELTTQQKDYATKTEGAAVSLLGLLNDILDFSKIEADKLTLELTPFRLDDLLRNLSVVLSANVGQKNVEVLFDIDPEIPAVLIGDSLRLQQVLINLGGNAVKFTEQGQVVFALRLMARREAEVAIEFSVRDSGIGIAPENQGKLFSAFSQAEVSTTRRFGGTGLGLAICQRLVQLMGGTIALQSQLGEGSQFSFTLTMPLAADDAVAPAQAAPTAPPRRVLVIDDNAIAGQLTQRIIESWGWQVDWMDSGAKALAHVAEQAAGPDSAFPYGLVCLDWHMPEMDGWETAQRLRQISQQCVGPAPHFIMITASGRETLAQRTQDEQDMLDGFLVKPLTAAMLLDAIGDAQAGQSRIRQMVKGRSSQRQLHGLRVLVVEDNLINQQVADELLTAEGALVSLAANGQLGVDAVLAAAPQFDVVLMDIQMPVLDGFEATRLIREELQLKDLPIIAMTANAMASDREACLAAGMNEHIGKPFDMVKLVALVLRITGFEPAPWAPSQTRGDTPLPSATGLVIQGLDVDTALARMSGMQTLYVRTASNFSTILSTVVDELADLVTRDDLKSCRMLLHTLKGNAATLGANALAAKVATLEKACHVPTALPVIRDSLPDLRVLTQTTRTALDQAVAALESPESLPTTAPTPPPVDAAVLAATLSQLIGMLEASDLGALQLFAEQRAVFENLPQNACTALDEALQDLDLEAALRVCRAAQVASEGMKSP